MKKELKKLNAVDDFILHSLCFNAHCSISLICSYMQKETPYGDEYQAAYEQYQKVLKEFDKLVDKLVDTVELRKKSKEEQVGM